MKPTASTFATIAVLGVLAFLARATPPGTLAVAVTSLVVFATCASRRARVRSLRGGLEDAERSLIVLMLVSSSVLLFSLATAIARAHRLDLVTAIPFVLALLGSVIHDAEGEARKSGGPSLRLVPVCGILVMLSFWFAHAWLGADRPHDTGLHTAAIESRGP